MDAIDWRAQLQPDSRQTSVNNILVSLKRYNSLRDEDELIEIQKIAQSVENKTYAGAASQSDYLQKISSKMLSIERQLQEEVYEKIKIMKETYLPELNEMYQKIATKLQQIKLIGVLSCILNPAKELPTKCIILFYFIDLHNTIHLIKELQQTHSTVVYNQPIDVRQMLKTLFETSGTIIGAIHSVLTTECSSFNSLSVYQFLKLEHIFGLIGQCRVRLDTLRRRIPVSGQEGLDELRRIAQRFEEKIYTAAASQPDYLRKISLKMLTMENQAQNTVANSMPSNPGGSSDGPSDRGSGMQSHVANQEHSRERQRDGGPNHKRKVSTKRKR